MNNCLQMIAHCLLFVDYSNAKFFCMALQLWIFSLLELRIRVANHAGEGKRVSQTAMAACKAGPAGKPAEPDKVAQPDKSLKPAIQADPAKPAKPVKQGKETSQPSKCYKNPKFWESETRVS